jgi:hypothetical protein
MSADFSLKAGDETLFPPNPAHAHDNIEEWRPGMKDIQKVRQTEPRRGSRRRPVDEETRQR